MENNEFNNNENLIAERPTFLKVLCILTFVSAGISSIMALLTPLIADRLIEFMQGLPNQNEAEMADAIRVLTAGWGYYSLLFVLSAASLVGAILMWQLKRIGFHIYALANSATLFVPMLMFSIPFSWFGILLTASFIGLYAMNLKYMK